MSAASYQRSETGTQRQVMSVSQLNTRIRDALQTTFPSIWVCGEISDLARPASGHVYLTLKDDQGQLRAVMWRTTAGRLGFDLKDGMEVVCEGHIDVYPPRGTYQLIIRRLEPQGIGALQLALRQLTDRLAAEGLFDPSHKKPLPKFPRQIAVITSPTGAAIRDFLEVVVPRWPLSRIIIVPTRVQGSEACGEIIRAIRQSHTLDPRPDILVITRGGGSLEDLWCFNEEAVVREIFRAEIPIVSAIGHEIDVTLSDLVADFRALTPTAAGQQIVPDRDQVGEELEHAWRRMDSVVQQKLYMLRARLDSLSERPVLKHPEHRIRVLSRDIDELSHRMKRSFDGYLHKTQDRLAHLAHQLEALSPLAVLSRGYSVTRKANGELLRSTQQLAEGDKILTRLAEGEVTSRVFELD